MKLTNLFFKALFEKSYQAIIVINERGIIELFNPAAERLFLYSATEAIGRNVNILMSEPHKKNHDAYIQAYLQTHVTHNIIGKGRELVAQRKDGLLINIFISVTEAKAGDNSHFIAIINNVDEIFGTRKTLKDLATLDILTQTYSRNYFEAHAYEWLLEYQKKQLPFSLLMLDLNGFKNINDVFGHLIGDRILIAFAKRLQDNLAPHDYLIRLGGDEFLIIMQGDYAAADKFTKTLLKILEMPYEFDDNIITAIPSIGIYAQAAASSLSNLLKKTDLALYAAKKSNNLIQFFTQTLENQFQHQHSLARILQEAVFHPDIFHVAFQPQVNLSTGKIMGFEALLCFHYEGKEIKPEIFIPIIETLGLSEQLNSMMLKKILLSLKKFQWPNTKKIKIAFNLSPLKYHFKTHLKSLLTSIEHFSKTYPNFQFEMEIIESKIIQDLKDPKQWSIIVALLKKYHVYLAIDDFGREYSSIYRLLTYPIKTLKIDKIFVSELSTTNQKAAKSVIKALATLGKELNINIIAKGIETEEEVQLLKKLGCTLAQGYYFFHPLPPEEAFILIGVK